MARPKKHKTIYIQTNPKIYELNKIGFTFPKQRTDITEFHSKVYKWLKDNEEAYEKMRLYPNAMIIGTHALIQEKAVYDNLALVITDEQHRFGVKQRDTFSDKGTKRPHILVMSATPIPRTLAIIIYGDMDISVINQVPAKRKPSGEENLIEFCSYH